MGASMSGQVESSRDRKADAEKYWRRLEANGVVANFKYEELERRDYYSWKEIEKLKRIAEPEWAALASRGSDKLGIPDISKRACIYVTGSLARYEATEGSDLDLFVVDQIEPDSVPLNYIENSHLISALDRIRLEAGFRPFSRGGEFVHTHSLQDVINRAGSPDDDATNTFTARILLLINSFPILNEPAYETAKQSVMDHYWRTARPDGRMRPIMLMNDIRRWWGVLGLNFEKYNPMKPVGKTGRFRTTAEREIANLKLRYARMLACFTPLLGFLDLEQEGGLKRSEVERVLANTPVERLSAIEGRAVDNRNFEVVRLTNEVLRAYDDYLVFIGRPKEELLDYFRLASRRRVVKRKAYDFHRTATQLIKEVGKGGELIDYVLV